MKSGDYIPSLGYLLICEVSFPEMCKMYDDNCLEYDIDDLARAYEERGIPWRVYTNTGQITIVWPYDLKGVEVLSESR